MLARREVMKVAAGLPLATVLAEPRLAAAAAAGLEAITVTWPDGRKLQAALAHPVRQPAPTLVLVHEWWGLNNQIKAAAAEFGKEGYLALAIDLYDGKVAETPDAAQALMRGVEPETATKTMSFWGDWLAQHEAGNRKVGIAGWCFGGGMALLGSINRPMDATVVYYGNVKRPVEELRRLKGPVLGHFATRDQWINREMVTGFEAAMKEAGKPFENHWYEADHAFANPTVARYNEPAAQLSWSRTFAFLGKHLSG
ncbi:MAG: dienelactone hydrolase family protein [Alphaproteobacteria bacterium]|nr:dienelactone hydrolase family protein [Alphaproteobacteria bacterium]